AGPRPLPADRAPRAPRRPVGNVAGPPPPAPPRHEDHALAVARADEAVLGPRRAVDEVPGLQVALLALDDQQALPAEDEEVLLVHLAGIAPARLARFEHRDRVAELRERRPPALQDACGAEHVVLPPRGVAYPD